MQSLLPVPRIPEVDQVLRIRACEVGNEPAISIGAPLTNCGAPSLSISAATVSQVDCPEPLALVALPLKRHPPSTRVAWLVIGLSDPAPIAFGSPNIFSKPSRERY